MASVAAVLYLRGGMTRNTEARKSRGSPPKMWSVGRTDIQRSRGERGGMRSGALRFETETIGRRALLRSDEREAH